MNKIIPILYICSLLISCGHKHQEGAEHHHGHKQGEHHEHKKKGEHHHHGEHVNDHMNKKSFEELVDNFESPERDKWQKPEDVIDLLGEINNKTIMDIGAGTGYFAFRMAARGANVIAADVDDRFLTYIEDKNKRNDGNQVIIRKTKYDDPLLKAEEVDHVIIVNTYHHIDDRVEYFKKVAQGLKEDGSLMIVDYKKEESPNGPPLKHRMAAESVVKELKETGFKDIQTNKKLLENQYIIIALKP